MVYSLGVYYISQHYDIHLQFYQLTKIIMKLLLKGIIIICIIGGCNSNSSQKPTSKHYIHVVPDILYENIITQLPHFFMVKDNYLYFQGSENKDGFLQVIDLKRKEEKYRIGKIGAGPGEFRTPWVHKSVNHGLIIEDVNSSFHAYVNIDSLFAGKPYMIKPPVKYRLSTRRIGLGENEILYLAPENQSPLFLDTPDTSFQFGTTPFKEEYTNGFSVNQGHIVYNKSKDLVAYAARNYPYIVTYKRKNNEFFVQNETHWDFNLDYLNGKIKLDDTKRGIHSLALSKDYIIAIQRDYEKDQTDENTVGWDLSKNPTTLFIYDYNLRFLNVVDLGMPISHLDANCENNLIYAISVKQDYVLVSYDLDLIDLNE
jgi:hypothetical protein